MNNQNQFSGNSESLFVENLPQKKVKIETECEETDRISKLPYAIIVQILSLLPIIDVFRTTVLYKYWQYFWTCINNIVYDNEEYGRLDSSTLHKFISLTDNVLPLLSCSSIKKLSFNFVLRYGDGLSYFPIIDKWLEFAVNKKVEDLFLNICHRTVYPIGNDQPYSFPEVLYSSSSIIKLNCKNCRILEDCVLNWTSLKILTLESLFLWDEHIKQIMSNCPQLEFLKIHKFCGFNCLQMTSPKCRRLQLIHHSHPRGDWYPFENDNDTCCFEIVAPYVEHLMISRGFNYKKIKLRDLSSWNHANLNLYCDEFAERDENIVKDFLVSVHCANELLLSSWLIKVISILMLEGKTSTYRCWITDGISSCISKFSFPLLDNLLRLTPKLENLMIFPDTTYHPFFENEVNELLKDRKYLSLEENIFKVVLQDLKNVKVMLLYSHTDTNDATKLDQFLKFLLEHAINLEKLVIVPEHKECNSCSTDTSNLKKNLLAFPTTSISTIISLGS